jgi:tetratricopeptide (TPR) repeat protein
VAVPARWIGIAALPIALAITLAVYARGLNAPFVFDDVVFAESSIVHVTSFPELRALIDASGVPRKLTMVTFALNFWVDGLRPLGYHLVNAALHGVAAWLLFLLMRRLLARAPDEWWRAHATTISTFGALVWMLHPVQTQAVVYTWQRATTLCAVCYLGALVCYVEGRTRESGGRWLWWIAAALLAAAGLVAKENAATLPAVIWLIERQFLSPGRRSRPWLLLSAVAALVAIALHYLGPRFVSMIDADFARRGFTPMERLLTESRVVMHYVSLLAFPHPSRLLVDYDVALSRSLWVPPTTALSVSAIVALVGLAIWWWRRVPLASVAVLWFLGHLVIESTIIPLDLAYEHRLYLPSTIPLVLGAGVLWRALGATRAATMALGLLCGLLAVWSAVRVEAWRDPVRLWADNAAKTPLKARVQGQLGKACLEAGQRDCAWRAFARATALDPSRVDAENGLASVLIDLDGDLPRAEAQLQTLLAREPAYVPALVNLAVVQLRTNRPAAAFGTLTRALKAEPSDRLVLLNLASAALGIGRYDAALAAADRGTRVWPRHAAFYALRGLAGLGGGHVDEARRDAAIAETLDPAEPLNAVLRARLRAVRP